jgi:hypothetical protein
MKNDFFMFGADEVVDNMRSGGISAGVAEPFLTDDAFYNRSRIVDTTVTVENTYISFKANIARKDAEVTAYGCLLTCMHAAASQFASRPSNRPKQRRCPLRQKGLERDEDERERVHLKKRCPRSKGSLDQ